MKPEVLTEEGVTIVRPIGKIDGVTSPGLQASVEQLLDEGVEKLVFDLSGVPFIASAGLRVFAVVAKRLTQGGVAAAGMTDNVAEVFRLVGFDRIMRLCDTAEAAKQELA